MIIIKQSYKTVKYLCNRSNKYNGKDASFLFRIDWLRDIKGFPQFLNQEARTLKSSKETDLSHISMWSLTTVDFFDLHRLFV